MEYLVIGPSSMGIFAFMGCLKQHEHKLKNILEISGSSAGALLGLFLALEIPLDDALDKLLKLDIASIMKYNIRTFLRRYGFIERDTIYNALVNMYGCNPKFSELKKKLHVATYNLNRGKTQYFSTDTHPSMRVLDAIYMSMSIPFLGSVKPYNGHIYLDGGTVEDVPITPFIGKSFDKIITFKLFIRENYIDKINTFTEFINTILSRVISLRKEVDLSKVCETIYVSAGDYNLFDFELTHEDKLRLFLLGYNSS
tara:strand:+ start:24585 stop:25349 length:765 start_codon:yes stop_codon:yes gene_type:complete